MLHRGSDVFVPKPERHLVDGNPRTQLACGKGVPEHRGSMACQLLVEPALDEGLVHHPPNLSCGHGTQTVVPRMAERQGSCQLPTDGQSEGWPIFSVKDHSAGPSGVTTLLPHPQAQRWAATEYFSET